MHSENQEKQARRVLRINIRTVHDCSSRSHPDSQLFRPRLHENDELYLNPIRKESFKFPDMGICLHENVLPSLRKTETFVNARQGEKTPV